MNSDISALKAQIRDIDKLLYDDVIHRLKASDSWVFLRAMLEMNYLDMDLFNFIPWLEGVSKYASTLLEASKAYRPMQNYLEDDFYGDSFE